MRHRRPFSLAIASIGVAFVLENVVRFIWTNDFRSYDVPVTRAMSVAGLRVGRDQLLILGVAVILMALAQAFLHRTRLGIAMRATADNPLLAAVKGVPTERVIAVATAGGGALAGGAGVFLGLDASIDPLMGQGLIISVFAAAILGGVGSAPGALGRGLDRRHHGRGRHPRAPADLQDGDRLRDHHRSSCWCGRPASPARAREPARMIAYLIAIATLVGVRALLTLGLNVQWGLAGLVNLGVVGFFAVGAYTSALLAVGGAPLAAAWPAASRSPPPPGPGWPWSRCASERTISRSSRSASPRSCGCSS